MSACPQILGRRTKNNPCLIGEPGVGKTAVAEGLAQKIASGDVPETIEGKQASLWLSFSYIVFLQNATAKLQPLPLCVLVMPWQSGTAVPVLCMAGCRPGCTFPGQSVGRMHADPRDCWPALQVVTLDMGLLVAGTKYRGEFEERLKKLMDEIKQVRGQPWGVTMPGGRPAQQAVCCTAGSARLAECARHQGRTDMPTCPPRAPGQPAERRHHPDD